METSLNALLFILYGCSFMSGFNENLMNVALVSIIADFTIDTVTAQWLITGYMIIVTVTVACMAFLYQRFSLRKLLFIAAGLNSLGSLGGFCANSFIMLLASRLVQAVGAGVFIPLMMNVIVDYAPHKKMGMFLSLGSAMITLGPATAPILTGYMVSYLGWHSVFLVPLVFGTLFMALGFFVIPKEKKTACGGFDLLSVALLAIAVTALPTGLSEISANLLAGILELAGAIVLLALFVRRQNSLEQPLISLKPMRSSLFWPAVVLVMITMMTYFSLSVVSPLYFEGGVGLDASMVGTILIFPVLGNASAAAISGKVFDRRGPWPLLPIGFFIACAGLALAVAGSFLLCPITTTAGIFFGYLGTGAVLSSSQTSGLKVLPADLHSHGVALMSTSLQLAACLGPALYIGIMSAVSQAAEHAGATPQTASSQGFGVAMIVSCIIVLCGLLLALRYSRRAKRQR